VVEGGALEASSRSLRLVFHSVAEALVLLGLVSVLRESGKGSDVMSGLDL
jgi:hypothetical protein